MTSVSTGSAMRSIRIPIILALLATAVFLVMPAAAHPPSDIVISYDKDAEKLSVTITHPVDDPKTHFIKRVQVKKNGEVISDPDYKSQPAKDTFTYTYDVKGLPGDTFRVIAICSVSGQLEKTMDVTVPATVTTTAAPATPQANQATPAPAPTTQKSPLGLLPVLGAAAFLLARK